MEYKNKWIKSYGSPKLRININSRMRNKNSNAKQKLHFDVIKMCYEYHLNILVQNFNFKT